MASGSAFYITYPSTISVASTTSSCYVTFFSQVYPMTCVVDTSSRTVKVYGDGTTTGLNTAVTAGQ
jgi:hypothetical protein